MIDYELLVRLNEQHIRELHEEAARMRLVACVRRLRRRGMDAERSRIAPQTATVIASGNQADAAETSAST